MELPLRIATFAFAALAAAATLPAFGQVNININVPGLVQMAPPPPRYEVMPGPRPGQVWVPGRWVWNDRDYVWQAGRWQQDRPDYVYAPGRWVQASGGWRWVDDQWKPGKPPKEGKHGHGHDQDDDGYHCPPGQAKKGRC